MNRDHIERHYPELAHLSRGGLMGALSIDPHPARESANALPAHLLVDPWVEPERWAETGGDRFYDDNVTCICGAPLGGAECRLRAHLHGPQPMETAANPIATGGDG